MTYIIYFSIYDKKMKCQIGAYSREQAIQILKDKIIIHKIDIEQDQTVEDLKNLFGIK
jgi:hypothetical protein